MANRQQREVTATTSVDVDYWVPAGMKCVFTFEGTGVWEFDSTGTAVVGSDTNWVAFTASASAEFVANIPASGHIRFNAGAASDISFCEAA